MTTFVLIHGGWHGGWCWRRVAPRLRATGHDVWTPTLTGLADRAHTLTKDTDLETHVRDVVGLLTYEELERVVLVGHSYAGMVISGAAAHVPERIGHLVYLDAFVPHVGDSLAGLLSPERESFYRTQAVQRGAGWRVPPPPVAALGVTDLADIAWVEERLTDQPLRSFDQPLRADAPQRLPRSYIHCTEGPIVASFAPFAARAQADPTWGYHELPTGHDAMITAPQALADVLLALVSDEA
jgi:pimeloyl-ACP methyl ester carboxylesterase